jgi:hypothetical protein
MTDHQYRAHSARSLRWTDPGSEWMAQRVEVVIESKGVGARWGRKPRRTLRAQLALALSLIVLAVGCADPLFIVADVDDSQPIEDSVPSLNDTIAYETEDAARSDAAPDTAKVNDTAPVADTAPTVDAPVDAPVCFACDGTCVAVHDADWCRDECRTAGFAHCQWVSSGVPQCKCKS